MNTATKNTVPALANSVKVVVDAVKAFQETSGAGVNAAAATAIINEHLHDETLFTKAQRPSAVKAINKQLGTKLSLTQIKRAATVSRAANPIHVDGLEGTAELPKGNQEPEAPAKNPGAADLEQAAAAPAAVASTETAFSLVGGIEQAATKNQTNITESSQEHNMQTLVAAQRTVKEAAAAGTPGEALIDAAAAAPVNAAPAANAAAPAADVANDAPGKLNNEQYESVLAQLGITNAKEVLEFRNSFFANHFAMYNSFKAVEEAHPEKDQKTKFGIWVGLNDENTLAFLAFSKAYIVTRSPEAELTLTEKVMTTFRGNRASGFSSGVVAVAAAVVGGAGEALMRGSVTIGSSVGTALGATAGYFAAEAAESLMESETGRYIVAGSIGLVAGGLGARIGRTVQDGVLNNAHADDVAQALPELKRPEALPAPVSGAASIMALF